MAIKNIIMKSERKKMEDEIKKIIFKNYFK